MAEQPKDKMGFHIIYCTQSNILQKNSDQCTLKKYNNIFPLPHPHHFLTDLTESTNTLRKTLMSGHSHLSPPASPLPVPLLREFIDYTFTGNVRSLATKKERKNENRQDFHF